jgi:hypothetical protein
MAAWELVPCLVQLRTEFNAVAPRRDKGADGSIGDSAHTSSSDHTPDEDSRILRDHDADSKNEVHALDIDSSGPWPTSGWFDATVQAIVAREKAEYESTDVYGRLAYVIWNRRIASRTWGWTWKSYRGSDPHTNHAHFSARYLTRTESDTRPWGVEEDDVALTDADIDRIAIRTRDRVLWDKVIPDYAQPETDRRMMSLGVFTGYADQRRNAILAAINRDLVDEQALATAVLAGLPVAGIVSGIVAALPPEMAKQVVTELGAAITAASGADE